MSLSVGASTNALSYLQSLLAQGMSGIGDAAGAGNPLSELLQSLSGSSAATDPSTSTAAGSGQSRPPFGTNTMAALISLQGGSASGVTAQSPSQLFVKIDSQTELASAKPGHGHHGHHMHGSGGAQSGGQSADASSSSSSLSSADGPTTQSTTNPDGSTTTNITYADGSSVEMTTPAVVQNGAGTSGNGTGNQSSANLIEKLIQMQSQLLASASSTLSAFV